MKIDIKQTDPDHRKQRPGENFYAQIDGENIGDKNTMFYKTKREAMAIARRYIIAKENLK